ncbi:MAG: carotenoid biosynthesis protein [Sphaerochaetaceae bacterium]|jgi:putative membrane protein|nr:carotenoid biosynthesis protein [Sphaerochaetaceae bacterium]MDX9939601.1 carotenoid biosynthesis protein [Sphaerochaetaceae bacterium]
MLNDKRYAFWVIRLLPVFYLVGFVSHLFDATFPLMMMLTPYTILGTAIIGFLPDILAGKTRLLIWAGATFLCTLFLEILGVATGAVFGAYSYGATLGLQVLKVPLLIGINWTLIIMGSAAMARRLTVNPWLVSLITASVTVLFDWIMEPVAIALDYWSWEGVSIPLQNYVAWFVISFLFTRLLVRFKLKTVSIVPSVIVLIQAVFFLLLRLFVA